MVCPVIHTRFLFSLSTWRSDFTGRYSLRAVEKIFKYLQRCYHDGSDLEAREGMLMASFEAGVAFTRANVGYVHAIAHTLGGLYHTPHGIGNAIVLPHVLKFYRWAYNYLVISQCPYKLVVQYNLLSARFYTCSDDEHCLHCFAQLAVAVSLLS